MNAEANNSIQIMALICIISFILIPEFSWLNVEGGRITSDNEENNFEVKHYSFLLEHTYPISENETNVLGYISSDCTNEIDEIHNCNYRSSLFYTIDNILSVSIMLCSLLILLAFRAEKYRKVIAAVFSVNLIITMSTLLIFTALIDNALETFTFSPGITYYLILICISVLFLGWFTSIEPLLESKKISWANAMKNNWQVFAIIAIIVFLWRINVLITNV